MNSQIFFAKILLFGEYGILKNSKAIIIPFHKFSGGLKIGNLSNSDIKKSNRSIKDLFNYLKKYNHKNNFNSVQFEDDLNNGLFFESTIPTGYGIGSSGALVAAIYHRYFFNKIDIDKNIISKNLIKLKELFSEIESYFHGTSSGIDPLNSYVGFLLLINSAEEIKITTLPNNDIESNRGLFIICSGKSSETGNFMKIFFDLFKESNFEKSFNKKFILPTDDCVNSLVNCEFDSFSKNFNILSQFTYEKLNPMIPANFNQIWTRGLNTGNYFLKLCGSGGGGYLIGFSNDLDKAKKELLDYKFEVIIKF